MVDIAIIADEDTLIGFKLAGIKDGDIFNPENIKNTLDKYQNAKLLIVTEKVGNYLREKEMLSKIDVSMIEIPDKSGSTGASLKNISLLFEQAIGVKLK